MESVYYSGLSKAEITKLAIIELFKKESHGFVRRLTSVEEESLKRSMEDKSGFDTIPENQT